MANKSTVNGTIDFTGPVKSIQAFLHFKELFENWYYNLTLETVDTDYEQLEHIVDQDPMKKTNLHIDFRASGRWYFERNLKDLMKNLSNERKQDDKWSESWSVEDEMCYQQLNQHPIKMIFEFYEVESGVEMLNESKYLMKLVKNKIREPIVNNIYIKQYEHTAENMHEIEPDIHAFDYSSYTVHDLDDNRDYYDNFDWTQYIKDFISDDLDFYDIGDQSTFRHRHFIKQLGKRLDKLRTDKNNYNVIYSDIVMWLEDEHVKKNIIDLLKDDKE